MHIHIPVEIEVGSLVLVVLIDNVKNNNYNLAGKWCEVIKIVGTKVQVTLLKRKFYVESYNIDKFIFGGLVMENPDFDIKKIIKK